MRHMNFALPRCMRHLTWHRAALALAAALVAAAVLLELWGWVYSP